MKVLDLQCAAGHGFEGWFGSEDDYAGQQLRGLLTCPTCGSAEVRRLPSAPRLNLGAGRATERATGQATEAGAASAEAVHASASESRDTRAEPARQPTAGGDGPSPAQRQAMEMEMAYLQAVKHLIAHTEDVGPRFAEEVRRIHHGEVEHRAIRGQASPEESRELREEGIEVLSLPIPAGLDGPLQ